MSCFYNHYSGEFAKEVQLVDFQIEKWKWFEYFQTNVFEEDGNGNSHVCQFTINRMT